MANHYSYYQLDVLLWSLGLDPPTVGFNQTGSMDRLPPQLVSATLSPLVVNTTLAGTSIFLDLQFADDVRAMLLLL